MTLPAKQLEEIRYLAPRQRIPGMEVEDVENEMRLVLWRASETHRPECGAFGSYWWSCWLNKRAKLWRDYYAIKRLHAIPMEFVPDMAVGEILFPLPPTTDALGRRVWGALAQGFSPSDVQEREGISRRTYYGYIQEWKNSTVWDLLTSP